MNSHNVLILLCYGHSQAAYQKTDLFKTKDGRNDFQVRLECTSTQGTEILTKTDRETDR